jgi:branched-chain amino acid transport system permease protein
MLMSIFIQQLINGLALGSAYAVFAIGCTLIFGILGIINMAHGALFMAGAYFGWGAVQLGLPLPLAFVVAVTGAGLLGALIEILIFRTLRERGGQRWIGLVASLSLARVLVGVVQEFFGTQVRRYPTSELLSTAWEFGEVRIRLIQVVIILSSLAMMAIFAFTLRKTSIGRAVRTVAFNGDVARIVGVPVERVVLFTFFIASALAGGAGLLLGILFNVVSPFMGELMLTKGLTVIILGGLGNIMGAVAGGFLLGLIEVLSVAYVSSSFRDAIGFALIFLILLIRPTGLFAGFQDRQA